METQETIRQFWFGTDGDPEAAQKQGKLWWGKDPAIDAMIRQRFEGTLRQAEARQLDGWSGTAGGCLALILLTDQFPRNMYRDSAQAFAGDALARGWCKDGIDRGLDRQLRPIERVFFYLPLEHSESLHDQYLAVALFEKLAGETAQAQSAFGGYLDFAKRHRDIVERFGRFPHRNAVLGRPSTPQELAFLQEKGSSF